MRVSVGRSPGVVSPDVLCHFQDIVAGDMSLKQLWEVNSSPAGTRPAGKVQGWAWGGTSGHSTLGLCLTLPLTPSGHTIWEKVQVRGHRPWQVRESSGGPGLRVTYLAVGECVLSGACTERV